MKARFFPHSLARCWIFLVFVFALIPILARADGGVVRVRETQGPFIVTLFSPADVAAGVPTDLTVMVQKSKTGEVLMDALVDVSLNAPRGAQTQSGDPICSLSAGMSPLVMPAATASATFRASRAHASNKMLYGLPIVLHAPGDWRINALVREGGEQAMVNCLLPVGATSARGFNFWFCVALPFGAIGLFALNQRLRSSATPFPKTT